MTLPVVTVLLDDGTGTFPHDISDYVLSQVGYGFSRGRQDWQGGVTAGALSLTLNNSDGRFTSGSTIIDSPSPITVDQQIRLLETIDGTEFTRFTGYVKSWPIQWPGTVGTIAFSAITAIDAQSRAERRPLRSVIEEEVLKDAPDFYYTLGEPEGATSAVDSSGHQRPPLGITGTGADVTFGNDTGPGTDGLTAVHFEAGRVLGGRIEAAAVGSILMAFNVEEAPAAGWSLLDLRDIPGPDGTSQFNLFMVSGGEVVAADQLGGSVATADSFADAHTHVVEMSMDGSPGFSLYVDGELIGTDTSGGIRDVAYLELGSFLVGTLAHVAIFPTASDATQAAAHADAMLNGFAGESGVDRITRLAGYANLPLGTLDASLTDVPFVDFTTSAAQDAIQQVVDAEQGVAFVDEFGELEFHNRNRVPTKTAPDLTLQANLYVTPDVQPVDDDQQLVNYLEATAAGTGAVQVAQDPTSIAAHGHYPGSTAYLVATDDEALDRANWVVANFSEPTTRYGTLTLNLYAMGPALAESVLAALEVDAWLRVTDMTVQNPGGTSIDVVVQGYSFQTTGDSWTATLNVVSRSLFGPVWILGDSTYGVLGSTTRLYV